MDNNEITKVQQLYVPERMRWITHRDKRILVHDYTDLTAGGVIEALVENSAVASGLGRTNLLLLVIVTGIFANKKLVKIWKDRAKRNRHLYKKVAVVGATGVLSTFMRAINKYSDLGAIPFDDIEQAKDWLVSDE